ncbi:nudix hydrolase 15, mitochondrial-like [Prosopis cineraria]|uniref:nudix hydrolase 15, mitochondrial-like n=1 Tax=Prosopis cineraria TaxID=364024 RepID=UPI002410295A|nr:nudix hydrolase 15, mitochondrial-like [Prosopis cineraria]
MSEIAKAKSELRRGEIIGKPYRYFHIEIEIRSLFCFKRDPILICLFEGDDRNLQVFLTLRTSSLSTHSSEVALLGGKREEGDANDVEMVLREAKEEIGLNPSLVIVITSLEPRRFMTLKYGMTITPVIGILSNKDAFTPMLNPNEVEELFDVPLDMFLKIFI